MNTKNTLPYLNALEREIERRANRSKVGPLGLGGNTTVLKVLMKELARLDFDRFAVDEEQIETTTINKNKA